MSRETSRTARSATTRTARQRPVARDRLGQLDFPTHEVPEGMRYQWIAETVLGEPQNASLSLNHRRGWRPVPSERHPSWGATDFYGRETDPFIRLGGQILCERSIEECEDEEELIRAETRDQIRSLDYETARQMDPTMPWLDPERKTRYERPRKSGRFEDD